MSGQVHGSDAGRRLASLYRTADPALLFEHQRHRETCDALELIADGLPDHVDRPLCASLGVFLTSDLPLCHRREEMVVFPLLQERARSDHSVGDLLAQLRREHSLGEGHAEELAEMLDALSRDGSLANPDMAGYMLRGFFETYRRHIYWEAAVILPLARRWLTADDLGRLRAQLAGQPT